MNVRISYVVRNGRVIISYNAESGVLTDCDWSFLVDTLADLQEWELRVQRVSLSDNEFLAAEHMFVYLESELCRNAQECWRVRGWWHGAERGR